MRRVRRCSFSRPVEAETTARTYVNPSHSSTREQASFTAPGDVTSCLARRLFQTLIITPLILMPIAFRHFSLRCLRHADTLFSFRSEPAPFASFQLRLSQRQRFRRRQPREQRTGRSPSNGCCSYRRVFRQPDDRSLLYYMDICDKDALLKRAARCGAGTSTAARKAHARKREAKMPMRQRARICARCARRDAQSAVRCAIEMFTAHITSPSPAHA